MAALINTLRPGAERWSTEPCVQKGLVMTKKKGEGVPALQNEDVTGLTEEKQEEIIKRSGRASRKEAAEEFYKEEGKQAQQSKPESSNQRK
jgi:hypothetical protein